FLTINLKAGAPVNFPDFIRLEGVRGRIDASQAQTAGTNLFVQLQSVNDPTANLFSPDTVRVATSLDGMNVQIVSDTLLLCFPTSGKAPGSTQGLTIRITESFARAFVDLDAANDGSLGNDRTDSGGLTTDAAGNPTILAPAALSAPTNSTEFYIWMESIPTSVSGITWPATT